MPISSTTLAGVNVWRFSGAVTDAEIKTAWAALIVNNRYRPNRTIYIDDTCSLLNVRGTYYVDCENLGIILHLSRNKANTLFSNWVLSQTVGLSVGSRSNFIRFTNGTTITNSATDGIDMKGGAMIYGVIGNPGGGDPRFLNEMMFGSLDGTVVTSAAWTEQEIEPTSIGTIWRGLNVQKAAGYPILQALGGLQRQVVYRSAFNTENATLRLIRPYYNNSVCYVTSTIRRQGGFVGPNMLDTFGSNGGCVIMILNNWRDESWFGVARTNFGGANWNGGNRIIGGVMKKIKVEPSTIVRTYDSRSTSVSQKSTFSETTADFLAGTDHTVSDAVTGNAQFVCVGAIATGGSIAITRYTGQKFTLQKFGYKVQVETPDMTFGDDDLSAFSPITMSVQGGISRTQSAINAATQITNFQELLEELHVLAVGLIGAQSYNAYNNGNLFDFTGGELKTNFTTVIVNPNASSKISYNAATNTLTIKASNLVGNETVNSWNNSIGTFIFQNGAVIQGVYVSSVGPSTVLQLNTPSDGYSLCLYNIDGVSKYFASGLNAGSYYVYFAPNEAGIYTFAAEKYGEKRTQDVLQLFGGNVWYNITDGEDVGITDSFATASALTTVSTTSQIYDVTAIFRLTEVGIKLGQLVARDGLYLDFADKNVKFKDDASAIIAVVNDTITYKSIVVNATAKYNAMKATPPQTITATDTEIINVLVEDANGDSKLSILGGDDAGYELWKVPTSTATDNYATGTLLATLASNDDIFRFIGIAGFDIVGRDISSGVRRRSSMLKGAYSQAFYVGNQIQLSTDAPQLIENNQKLDELLLKVDTKLDVAVSTRLADADYVEPATPQNVLDAKTEILVAIAEIPVTDISDLALEATSQAIKTTVEALENYDDQVLIGKVDGIGSLVIALENYDDTILISKVDAIQTSVDNIDVDFTPVLYAVDTKPTLSEIEAGKVGDIKTKLDTLQNADFGTTNSKIDAVKAKVDTLQNADFGNTNSKIDAVKAKVDTLQNADFGTTNSKIDAVKTKVDTLENYNDATAQTKLDGIKAKTDVLENADLTGIATATDLQNAKDSIETQIDNIAVDNEAIAAEVWSQEPDRLKQVATVETTGDQLAAFNNA
ncbi:hypothetical protein MCERE19_02212 [Spirosomataceae bacterium]